MRREDAIKILQRIMEKTPIRTNGEDLEALEMAIKALEDVGKYRKKAKRWKNKWLKSQKSGKWQRVSIDKYIQLATAYYECSECGGQTIGELKYCPNCGAKMFEPQEREDK